MKRKKEGPSTTVISFEEQMRGWMSYIAAARSVRKEVEAYAFLIRNLQLFCGMALLPFDAFAATKYQQLRKLKLRIGTMDLKIAAIVLVNGGILLTKNSRDFQQIPELKFEDWLK